MEHPKPKVADRPHSVTILLALLAAAVSATGIYLGNRPSKAPQASPPVSTTGEKKQESSQKFPIYLATLTALDYRNAAGHQGGKLSSAKVPHLGAEQTQGQPEEATKGYLNREGEIITPPVEGFFETEQQPGFVEFAVPEGSVHFEVILVESEPRGDFYDERYKQETRGKECGTKSAVLLDSKQVDGSERNVFGNWTRHYPREPMRIKLSIPNAVKVMRLESLRPKPVGRLLADKCMDVLWKDARFTNY